MIISNESLPLVTPYNSKRSVLESVGETGMDWETETEREKSIVVNDSQRLPNCVRQTQADNCVEKKFNKYFEYTYKNCRNDSVADCKLRAFSARRRHFYFYFK